MEKLADQPVSAWTVAELLVLGDQAVLALADFASAASAAPAERRKLAATILEAIGTPAAREAVRRSAAAKADEMRSCDGAA
ncbi:MAG TPA: hypothetical protein VHO06_17080 [Polyangia bacterium]|nr:hypothetical protein [Polyangia bacterium]